MASMLDFIIITNKYIRNQYILILYIHTCIYMYMYACTYVCMYVCVRMYVCIHVYMQAGMYVCMLLHMYIIYISMCVCSKLM